MPSTQHSPVSWDDPELNTIIDRRIERIRKTDYLVRVVNAAGAPVPGVGVHVRQTGSSFHFGANLFMLDGYPSRELNARYEQRFLDLFNASTIPFYWAGLEPEKGVRRFSADSPPVTRRPPPDRSVAFCQTHGLRMHGHVLVWDHAQFSIPAWMPEDLTGMMTLWENHVREIGERYGGTIKRWDVVNEVVPDRGMPISRPMPAGYARTAFTWAERHLPADCQLDINELSDVWHGLMPRYVDLIRDLIADGARAAGIGLQCHLSADEVIATLAGKRYRPGDIMEVLDAASAFGVPVHISEITVPPPANDAVGLERQAQVARDFYRLWFSHPAVTGITWWNVPDGGHAANEPEKRFAGILDQNLDPKPAYLALRDLIKREWRTQTEGVTDAEGCFRFRGFHGSYQIHSDAGASFATILEPGKTICQIIRP